jgi:TP901 family phage tail tape measure protein
LSDYAISTAFLARDRITKAFGTMGRGATTFGDRASKAFRKASKSGSRFGDILKGVLGANIIMKGFAILKRGIGEVIQQFISLDDAIMGAVARFSDVNIATVEGRASMEALRKKAREVGAATQFTATQAAQGLLFMAQAGLKSLQAMAALPGLTDLATIGILNLDEATDIATQSMGAFRLITDDTAQLMKNFTRFNNVLAISVSRSNARVQPFFETVTYGASAFTAAGQSIETFGALLSGLANASIQGSMAGTILKNTILKLADSASQAKLAQRLGVNVLDAKGNIRDVLDILDDVGKNLDKIKGTGRQIDFLKQVFDRRAVVGIMAILQTGIPWFRKFRDQLEGATDEASVMADVIRQSLGNRIKAVTSAALELGFKLLSAFEERGRIGLDKFIHLLRTLDITPIIEMVENLYQAFKNIWEVLGPLVTGILPPLLRILVAITSVLAQLSPILVPLVTVWLAYAAAVKVAAIAQGILNVIQAASPLGLLITGIGLLIGGIIWASKHTDKLGKVWQKVWGAIKKAFFTFLSFYFKGFSTVIKLALNAAKIVGKFFGINTSGIDNVLAGIDKIQGELDKRSFLNDEGNGLRPVTKIIYPAMSTHETKFTGMLNIAGAPQGSFFKADATATNANFDVNLLGQNP